MAEGGAARRSPCPVPMAIAAAAACALAGACLWGSLTTLYAAAAAPTNFPLPGPSVARPAFARAPHTVPDPSRPPGIASRRHLTARPLASPVAPQERSEDAGLRHVPLPLALSGVFLAAALSGLRRMRRHRSLGERWRLLGVTSGPTTPAAPSATYLALASADVLPPYDALRVADIAPAVRALEAQWREELVAIEATAAPGDAASVTPIARLWHGAQRAGEIVALLRAVMGAPALDAAALESTGALSRLAAAIELTLRRLKLEDRLSALSILTEEDARVVGQLAEAAVGRGQPTEYLVLAEAGDLEGLPRSMVDAAAGAAGSWAVPVDDFGRDLVLRYAERQDVRRRMAQRCLDSTEAGDRAAALSSDAWDALHTAEAAATARRGLGPNSLRPYFPFPTVWDALCAVAAAAYGATVGPHSGGAPVWDPAVTAYDLRGPGGARAVLYVDPYARFGDKTLAGWSVLTVRGPNPGDPPAVVLVGTMCPEGLAWHEVEGLFGAFGAALTAALSVDPARWAAQRAAFLATAPAKPLPERTLTDLIAPAPRPPVAPGFYHETLLDRLALALFRKLVQREVGYVSVEPGYAGLVDEARHYLVRAKATKEDQQAMVVRVLSTLAGPAVPPVYRTFMAPWPWAPALTALFTPPFFRFLVGPNRVDLRTDGAWGGVYVERCRFLEETGCKGLCLNLCKLPTQTFFHDVLGLDMTMNPNFETHECRLSFGLAPTPVATDPTVPVGCLSSCTLSGALREARLPPTVVCSPK